MPIDSTAGLSFSGQTVLVTGSSRNLGLAIAIAFIEAGARVVLHGCEANFQATYDGLQASYPEAELLQLAFDLSDATAIDRAFQQLDAQDWMPDVLVNNAAHLGLNDDGVLGQSPEFFREVLEVNLFGAFRCCQLVAQHQKQHEGGAIVNISSLASQQGIYGRSAYNVSKAALDGLTRSMAQELSGDGIRVNSLVLGYVWTERWNHLPAGVEARRLKNMPAGAPSSQQEIARTVLFLASASAPTLVGAQLILDGGMATQQLPRDVGV
ncbi:SDR family NAD(P)-dependent oxidoreductase [Coraliomargarita sp. SDUM461004]|uniref:SDR family NAD(P)-dependent oxidoreductase n=1 Tax=Thalassobacterium sedimentorum TaxID=3041258 RepID=A0ABU1AK12_9BACT|nr:SDR family oxidoreductase [Coraliomargarita sp. SDUM461004]MDQ8194076.1 SDR family NAD(P)-dependent oxidoreductase [Coraliomargarita sp. SDUM461004]